MGAARVKRVLLLVTTSTHFSDLFRLARAIRATGKYAPSMLFVVRYATRAQHLRACEDDGIPFEVDPAYLDPAASPPQPGAPQPPPPAASLSRRLAAGAARVSPVTQAVAGALARQRARIAYAEHVFEAGAIDLLALAGDVVHYDSPAFIRAAHRRGIPAVIVPSWMAGPLEAAEALRQIPLYAADRGLPRAFAALLPRWSFVHKGMRLLRLPAPDALAMELLSLAPPRPWVLHSGHADAIAVESEFMRDYCVREGLDPERLVVTGSAAHDTMHGVRERAAQARAELCRRLSLAEGRPLLLSAVPPDQLYSGGRPGCEFSGYEALVEFWVRSLGEIDGYNVVLSLHPSQKREDWAHLERFGPRISDERIEGLIPLCDVFVASISSTIQWAIAASKPTINYDVYLYRHPAYQNASGVLLAARQDEYLRLLRRLTADTAFFSEIARRQETSSAYYGRIDGRAADRLASLFDRLADGILEGRRIS